MADTQKTMITVEATVDAPIEKAWEVFTTPKHVMAWNQASPDWHCPKAENDLRVGGRFSYTMAAKDGSFSFDFMGTYTEVVEHSYIAYTMGDGRTAELTFTEEGDRTLVVETFEPETENTHELQRGGWQAILDSYATYAGGV
jgi:uncharacterized protein YndB with AHSA1/START domain